jgi:hypothetical protein
VRASPHAVRLKSENAIICYIEIRRPSQRNRCSNNPILAQQGNRNESKPYPRRLASLSQYISLLFIFHQARCSESTVDTSRHFYLSLGHMSHNLTRMIREQRFAISFAPRNQQPDEPTQLASTVHAEANKAEGSALISRASIRAIKWKTKPLMQRLPAAA